ncbi:MAG: hypothetical protein GY819_01090 [Planctomycetaceae bacterium]|nr:hypothetical protein [Planctomycetaceae bacterium]MCP4461372.1 hypothetical protein [Planctomycetaceae bacterium]
MSFSIPNRKSLIHNQTTKTAPLTASWHAGKDDFQVNLIQREWVKFSMKPNS